TATPSQFGSLFCLHYNQNNPNADISSLDSGSVSDANGHFYFSSGPMSVGTIYQAANNTQTASSVTVGAAAPTGAMQSYGMLVEYFAAPPIPVQDSSGGGSGAVSSFSIVPGSA